MNSELLKQILIKKANYKVQTSSELREVEESMFCMLVNLFDIRKQQDFNTDKSKNNLENEQEQIQRIRDAINNYKITETVLYMLSNTHDNWVEKNSNKFTKKLENEEIKFVPFLLLSWDDAKKDLSVLQPILQSLEIECDEDVLKKEFEKQQVIFLINNNIFKTEDLKDKLQKGWEFYPSLYDLKNENDESIDELFKTKSVIDKITEQIQGKISLDLKNNFKKLLSYDKDELGFVQAKKIKDKKVNWSYSESLSQKNIGIRKQALPKIHKPMLKSMYRLLNECGIIFLKDIYKSDYYYYDITNTALERSLFVTYEECDNNQKKLIDRRNELFKEFSKNVENSNSDKYDKQGTVSLVIVNSEKNKGSIIDKVKSKVNKKKSIHQIDITQRELAEIGVLPSEVGWVVKTKALITSTDIAEADKNRKFISKIFEKISAFFKGLLNKEIGNASVERSDDYEIGNDNVQKKDNNLEENDR